MNILTEHDTAGSLCGANSRRLAALVKLRTRVMLQVDKTGSFLNMIEIIHV